MLGFKASAQNFFTYSDGALLRNDSIDLAYLNHLDTIDFYDTVYKLQINPLSSSFYRNIIYIQHPDYPDSAGVSVFVNAAEYTNDSSYYWYGHSKILFGDTICKHAKLSILRDGALYSGQMVLDTVTYNIKTLPSGAIGLFQRKDVEYDCISTRINSLGDYEIDIDDLTEIESRSQKCFVEVLVIATDQAANANSNFMIEVREGLLEANTAFARSGISNLSFRLANQNPVLLPSNYQWFWEDLDKDIDKEVKVLRQTFSNNIQPNIGWYRDENRADIVIMLTSGRYNPDGNKMIFGATGTLLGDIDSAFVIIDVNNIRTDKTLAHELAHVFGARHEPCTGVGVEHSACNKGPNHTSDPWELGELYARAHKFGKWTDKIFGFNARWRDYRTIMHTPPNVEDKKKNIWLDNFSNPGIRVHDFPTGIANERHNSRLLTNMACTVSDFREEEIPTNLYVSTNGPYIVCPCNYIYINSGIHGSSTPSGGTYLWELTFDGVNYTTVGTSSDLGYVHDCNVPFAHVLLFRLTVTFPGAGQIYTYHHVEIGASNDQGIPCAITRPVNIVNNYIDELSLNVFPNPVSHRDEIFIQLIQSSDSIKNYKLDDLKSAQIVVTEISGKQITTHAVNERFSNSAISVPIKDLLPGMYMISLRFSDGRQISSKFVKQ